MEENLNFDKFDMENIVFITKLIINYYCSDLSSSAER